MISRTVAIITFLIITASQAFADEHEKAHAKLLGHYWDNPDLMKEIHLQMIVMAVLITLFVFYKYASKRVRLR